MINRREINIESLIEVAEALGDLNDRAVYVGGAVVSLYVNDPPRTRKCSEGPLVGINKQSL